MLEFGLEAVREEVERMERPGSRVVSSSDELMEVTQRRLELGSFQWLFCVSERPVGSVGRRLQEDRCWPWPGSLSLTGSLLDGRTSG